MYPFRKQSRSPYLSRCLHPCKRGHAASRSASSVMAAIEQPLIRIRSGSIPGALEILWALLSSVMLMRLGFGYRRVAGIESRCRTAFPQSGRRG